MVYKNDEQACKARFVEIELSQMLNVATCGFVDYCDYLVQGQDECVIVKLVYGEGHYDTTTVNVTADSNWAILKDVTKAVAKLFE